MLQTLLERLYVLYLGFFSLLPSYIVLFALCSSYSCAVSFLANKKDPKVG